VAEAQADELIGGFRHRAANRAVLRGGPLLFQAVSGPPSPGNAEAGIQTTPAVVAPTGTQTRPGQARSKYP
jgi:hypothetical protein